MDISAALIGKARDAGRARRLGIQYRHADIASPDGLGDAEFDAVTCNFGLTDIDDLAGAVSAISAALRPGGCFVFSLVHPLLPRNAWCFRLEPAPATRWTQDRPYADRVPAYLAGRCLKVDRS